MQKMSNGDYFDEKMRRGDRSKEARRISPPLKLLLKSPKLRGSTAPKSAHLHRGREQGGLTIFLPFCVRHPLSLQSVLKLSILNRNACLQINVSIHSIIFVVFSNRSMTICLCRCLYTIAHVRLRFVNLCRQCICDCKDVCVFVCI